MKTTPEITVIVPVYKGVATLRAAVGSLAAQSFPDWECILVDDGSKDGSGAVADALAAEDGRVRVLHRQNGGTSAARNTGLDAARGRYVAFLDEDDAYHPRFLEVLYAEAEATGAEIVGCELVKFENDDCPVLEDPVPSAAEWTVAGKDELRDWVTRFYYGVPFEVWRNLYRRELIVGHRFELGVRVEQDLRWHYSLLPRVSLYAKTAWRGYAWRQSATGGYLHPDAASLVSLLDSYRRVLTETAAAMGLSPEQRKLLGKSIATDIRWNVWRHLRGGMRPGREDLARIRRGIRFLAGLGARLVRYVDGGERLRARLFLLTGWSVFL